MVVSFLLFFFCGVFFFDFVWRVGGFVVCGCGGVIFDVWGGSWGYLGVFRYT